jgi:hypothetical protein
LPKAIEKRMDAFSDPLGRHCDDPNVWAREEGLRGSAARELFDGFRRLFVAGGQDDQQVNSLTSSSAGGRSTPDDGAPIERSPPGLALWRGRG